MHVKNHQLKASLKRERELVHLNWGVNDDPKFVVNLRPVVTVSKSEAHVHLSNLFGDFLQCFCRLLSTSFVLRFVAFDNFLGQML